MANKSIPRIEGILLYYTLALGKDYNAYRNHVYRVYHLTLLLNPKELSRQEQEALGVAAAFHDLGIWTHSTMDYLVPSVDLASAYLEENNSDSLATLTEKLILFHHKTSSLTESKDVLTESFRKADQVDLSWGSINHKLPKKMYTRLVEEFPLLGFQKTILKKVMMYAFKHPLRPFPMMKR